MEKLALLIFEKLSDGQWMPVKDFREGPSISFLLFVDDCLLFLKAKVSQVRLLNETLNLFCKASGLKINMEKSKFMASKCVSRTKC